MTAYKVYNTKNNRTPKYFDSKEKAKAFVEANRKDTTQTRITTIHEDGRKTYAYAAKGYFKYNCERARKNEIVELITTDLSGWKITTIEIN